MSIIADTPTTHTPTTHASGPSSPGPKGGGADVRGGLLAAGRALYEEHGFDLVSLRAVAERAGVNQAMVRYYFRDKHGFVAALLDDGFEHLFAAIPEGAGLRAVLERMIARLNHMPWLPVLMMQSVYLSAELRGHFVRNHVPRIIALLGSAAPNVVSGRAGPEEEGAPAYGVLAVISMLVFPQLARPVVGPVLGVTFDDRFAREFAGHMAGLLDAKDAREDSHD